MYSTQIERCQELAANHDKAEAANLKLARLGGYIGEQAKTRLIKDQYLWIIQRCTQILRNEADAHDAAQEVVLRMHKSLGSFEARSALRTWLNTIVHNECVSLIRKQQRNALTRQISSLIEIYETDRRSCDSSANLSTALVHNVLEALPAHDREVLHLRFFSELPIAEIGVLLGISISAAKMRLYRALDAFKLSYLTATEETPAGAL